LNSDARELLESLLIQAKDVGEDPQLQLSSICCGDVKWLAGGEDRASWNPHDPSPQLHYGERV
jgi:hypothetical protein